MSIYQTLCYRTVITKSDYGGQRYLEHIRAHRKGFYTALKMQCKLDAHLQEVDARASEMYDCLVKQLTEKEGITEDMMA